MLLLPTDTSGMPPRRDMGVFVGGEEAAEVFMHSMHGVAMHTRRYVTRVLCGSPTGSDPCC